MRVPQRRRNPGGQGGNLAQPTQSRPGFEQNGRQPQVALSEVEHPEIEVGLADAEGMVGGLGDLDRLLTETYPIGKFPELAEASDEVGSSEDRRQCRPTEPFLGPIPLESGDSLLEALDGMRIVTERVVREPQKEVRRLEIKIPERVRDRERSLAGLDGTGVIPHAPVVVRQVGSDPA